eukprot:gb/GECG01002770.1/.p1 GENE.gb/GECG01002770.1/~~gb/GECG01002770.1/.p1  ORF type:complete len:115 (+),score=6.26 gb/GECG01002770.1/:1-345(+)
MEVPRTVCKIMAFLNQPMFDDFQLHMPSCWMFTVVTGNTPAWNVDHDDGPMDSLGKDWDNYFLRWHVKPEPIPDVCVAELSLVVIQAVHESRSKTHDAISQRPGFRRYHKEGRV